MARGETIDEKLFLCVWNKFKMDTESVQWISQTCVDHGAWMGIYASIYDDYYCLTCIGGNPGCNL